MKNFGKPRKVKARFKVHGFLARMRTPGGRAVLSRRRSIGRKVIAVK